MQMIRPAEMLPALGGGVRRDPCRVHAGQSSRNFIVTVHEKPSRRQALNSNAAADGENGS